MAKATCLTRSAPWAEPSWALRRRCPNAAVRRRGGTVTAHEELNLFCDSFSTGFSRAAACSRPFQLAKLSPFNSARKRFVQLAGIEASDVRAHLYHTPYFSLQSRTFSFASCCNGHVRRDSRHRSFWIANGAMTASALWVMHVLLFVSTYFVSSFAIIAGLSLAGRKTSHGPASVVTLTGERFASVAVQATESTDSSAEECNQSTPSHQLVAFLPLPSKRPAGCDDCHAWQYREARSLPHTHSSLSPALHSCHASIYCRHHIPPFACTINGLPCVAPAACGSMSPRGRERQSCILIVQRPNTSHQGPLTESSG